MRLRRGSSLLEVIVASGLLIVALVGVMALLSRATVAQRDGDTSVVAASLAQQTVAEISASGFASLTAGTGFDGGVIIDSNGRRYGRIIDVFPGDAGIPSFDVRVTVEYSSSLPPPLQTVLRTTTWASLSRTPDGGP
jgi:Tfp pilus assembly protein PilV